MVPRQLNLADAVLLTRIANSWARALAITPLKSRAQKWDEVVRVNQEYPLVGLKAIAEARGSRSSVFRFMYMSGESAPRDSSKKPAVMGDYLLMRVCHAVSSLACPSTLMFSQGETENQVLTFAAEHKDAGFEACVAKPGLITSAGSPLKTMFITAASWVGASKVDVSECVAAMIDQVMNGFEKDPLANADLVTLGRKVLERDGKP
jgi:hypothetical protein